MRHQAHPALRMFARTIARDGAAMRHPDISLGTDQLSLLGLYPWERSDVQCAHRGRNVHDHGYLAPRQALLLTATSLGKADGATDEASLRHLTPAPKATKSEPRAPIIVRAKKGDSMPIVYNCWELTELTQQEIADNNYTYVKDALAWVGGTGQIAYYDPDSMAWYYAQDDQRVPCNPAYIHSYGNPHYNYEGEAEVVELEDIEYEDIGAIQTSKMETLREGFMTGANIPPIEVTESMPGFYVLTNGRNRIEVSKEWNFTKIPVRISH